MADEKEKEKDKDKDKAAADAKAAPAKKGGAAGTAIGIVLTALFATGGAFGGAKLGAGKAAPRPEQHEPEVKGIPTVRPPGATVALEPFLLTVNDAQQKPHAIKLTIVLELRPNEKEDVMKPFIPRIRDAMLSYLRALTYEEASNNEHVERMRGELIERFSKLGAIQIDQVLITDFVMQ